MRAEIPKANELEQEVFTITNEKEFVSIALRVYHFQFANNPVYQRYCTAIKRTPENTHSIEEIPFLPISFFKTHSITTASFEPELIFKSSGTTGNDTSSHYVKSSKIYEESFFKGFEKYYGDVKDYCIIGLLPSYLERGHSSLVYMVDRLIKKSKHKDSGFYLHELDMLFQTLSRLESSGQKTMLIGVTYALLDFAENHPLTLKNTIIMETGGMKGRRREMIKTELYKQLKTAFGVRDIHSEYGMTELLSQAYAKDGIFTTPPWMKILVRDETDPFSINSGNSRPVSGAINIIDLANIYSCSFIATDDVGKIYQDNSFEILGRMDHSDIRGCSLMAV